MWSVQRLWWLILKSLLYTIESKPKKNYLENDEHFFSRESKFSWTKFISNNSGSYSNFIDEILSYRNSDVVVSCVLRTILFLHHNNVESQPLFKFCLHNFWYRDTKYKISHFDQQACNWFILIRNRNYEIWFILNALFPNHLMAI